MLSAIGPERGQPHITPGFVLSRNSYWLTFFPRISWNPLLGFNIVLSEMYSNLDPPPTEKDLIKIEQKLLVTSYSGANLGTFPFRVLAEILYFLIFFEIRIRIPTLEQVHSSEGNLRKISKHISSPFIFTRTIRCSNQI